MEIKILFPIHFNRQRISYCCWNIACGLRSEALDVKIYAPSASNIPDDSLIQCLPFQFAWRVLAKFWPNGVSRITEKWFLRHVKDGELVYLWSDISDECIDALQRKQAIMFREKFNILKFEAKQILDKLYESRAVDVRTPLTDEGAEHELRQLKKMDYIFVANPLAKQAFLDNGVKEEAILLSSYGWDPERFDKPSASHLTKQKGLRRLLFVGVGDLNKGVDILLKAWAKADVEGQFVIAGTVDENVKKLCSEELERDDVKVTGWLDNPSEAFNTADIFAFPSHQEGGPLVVYEAMGSGLPVLASPFGAGAIARDGIDGKVLTSYDIGDWAEAIRDSFASREKWNEYASNAGERAKEFTWPDVGRKRREQIIQKAEEAL